MVSIGLELVLGQDFMARWLGRYDVWVWWTLIVMYAIEVSAASLPMSSCLSPTFLACSSRTCGTLGRLRVDGNLRCQQHVGRHHNLCASAPLLKPRTRLRNLVRRLEGQGRGSSCRFPVGCSVVGCFVVGCFAVGRSAVGHSAVGHSPKGYSPVGCFPVSCVSVSCVPVRRCPLGRSPVRRRSPVSRFLVVRSPFIRWPAGFWSAGFWSAGRWLAGCRLGGHGPFASHASLVGGQSADASSSPEERGKEARAEGARTPGRRSQPSTVCQDPLIGAGIEAGKAQAHTPLAVGVLGALLGGALEGTCAVCAAVRRRRRRDFDNVCLAQARHEPSAARRELNSLADEACPRRKGSLDRVELRSCERRAQDANNTHPR